MANLNIIGANVRAPVGIPVQVKLAASNFEPMEAVYAINTNYVAKANAANANLATVIGITVTRAYTDQPVGFVGSGTMLAGANTNLVVGETYILSNVPGNIAPVADIVTNSTLTVVGYGLNVNYLQLAINPTGIVHE